MIEIDVEDGDDAAFVAMVRAVATTVVGRYSPSELIVVKIDNWFGPKWVRFSGKILGALGVWKQTLTVPPFVPARVRWQRSYRPPSFELGPPRPPLHITTDSESALKRRFSDVAPGATVLWFSGDSATNRRAAVMVYAQENDEGSAWYAGWLRKDTWRPLQLSGISTNELRSLLGGEADRRGPTGR